MVAFIKGSVFDACIISHMEELTNLYYYMCINFLLIWKIYDITIFILSVNNQELSLAEKLDFYLSIFFNCFNIIFNFAWFTFVFGSRRPPLSIVLNCDVLSKSRLDLLLSLFSYILEDLGGS
jgi:hypothetical protein